MADIIQLHPKVRENREPRMSAAALAEYLISKSDQQETILHNCRYSSPPQLTPHSQALVPIRNYCADLTRPEAALERAKQGLAAKAEDISITPKSREESLRCIETIELFQKAKNAFGINGLRLVQADRRGLIAVEGVAVSSQPDLLIQVAGETSSSGVILFRPQKAPDPFSCRLEETKRQRGENRREMARYMLAIAHLTFDLVGDLGKFDRERSFVADIRLGERIAFSSSDHAARVRAIRSACRQIARLWPTIEPRNSVLAKFSG